MLLSGFPVLVPLPASVGYASSRNTLAPGFASWDETSLLMNAGADKPMACQDELNNLHHGNEGMHTPFVCCLFEVNSLHLFTILNATVHHLLRYMTLLIQLILDQRG